MSDAHRPPPYRPRPKEGEPDREVPLAAEELRDRDALIRIVLVAMVVGAYSGIALLTRELPGGDLPYLSKVPSVALWLVAIVLAAVWSRRKPRILALLAVFTLLAAASVLGAGIAYNRDKAAWSAAFHQKFDQ